MAADKRLSPAFPTLESYLWFVEKLYVFTSLIHTEGPEDCCSPKGHIVSGRSMIRTDMGANVVTDF